MADSNDFDDYEVMCKIAHSITPDVLEQVLEACERYNCNTSRTLMGTYNGMQVHLLVTNDPDEMMT